MKNLLTIVVNGNARGNQAASLYDGIEFIYPEKNETEKDFILRAAKNATGKYSILLDQKFRFADVSSLLNILDKNAYDTVSFNGGTAIKTSIVKSAVKDCVDLFSCFILSILSCKTLLKSLYIPFIFESGEIAFTEENYNGILMSAEAFGAMKSKLSKDLYSQTLNALCTRLTSFYLYAMISIKAGSWDGEKLISFDGKLKSEIVLYLALEKNFTAGRLSKLRKKNFKISRLTVNKFKKILKMK